MIGLGGRAPGGTLTRSLVLISAEAVAGVRRPLAAADRVAAAPGAAR